LLNTVLQQFGGQLIAALPAGIEGINDTTFFSFKLDLPDELINALITGLADPDDVNSQALVDLVADAINPFAGWEVLFASTITFNGFKLGSVSGFIFGPQDVTASDFELTTFGQRVRCLDPLGTGTPVEAILLEVTNTPNLIPVSTKQQYDNMIEYGGLLLTGQLYLPDIISDPVAVITTVPEWAETTIKVGGSEFLVIQAVESGTNLNNVQIIFLNEEGIAGKEVAEYDESNILRKALIITVEDGVSTAQQIADAIEAEGTFRVKGVNPDDIADPDCVVDLSTLTAGVTAGGVNGIDWTLPNVDFTDITKIMDNFDNVKAYIDEIIEGLTRQSEWAKLQMYIASPAGLFNLNNYLEPGSTRARAIVTSSTDVSFKLELEAREYGPELNGVSIVFETGSTVAASFDPSNMTLTITVRDGVTTAGDVVIAILKEGTFTATTTKQIFVIQVSNILAEQTSGGSIEDLAVPVDFDSLAADAQQLLLDIMGAGYIEGYSKLKLFGIELGETFIEGTINGIAAEADIPWLAGLTARLETGWKETSRNQIFYDLLTSPIAAAVVDLLGIPGDPAETFSFLLDDTTPDVQILFPVGGFEAMLSSENFLQWLSDNFGLPEQVVTAASDLASTDFFFGAYTPGYGGPEDSGVKRNGGFRLEAALDIEGLIEDAWFEFEIEFFNPLENTDWATFVLPNFVARASVPNLSIPGIGPDSSLLTLSDFYIKLTKDPVEGLSFELEGNAMLFGLRFVADGEFSLSDEGLFGGILLELSSGIEGLTLGGNSNTPARIELKSPGLDNDFRIESYTVNAAATITSTLNDFKLFIEAAQPGSDFNGVFIEFEDGAIAGNETAVYDDTNPFHKVLRITVEDGVTAASQIAKAIEDEGTFRALAVNENFIDIDSINAPQTSGWIPGTLFNNVKVSIIDDVNITDDSANAVFGNNEIVIRINNGVTKRSSVIDAVNDLEGWIVGAETLNDGAADGIMSLNNLVDPAFGFDLSGQFILLVNTSDDGKEVVWNLGGVDTPVPLNANELRIHADGE
ncbi:MAG: hypothetical protein MUQ25_15605, partial [Candidatus Aminicenantes bacterium]|nr:hypothetical protein [Candidatus Aminicenantes bacterium]